MPASFSETFLKLTPPKKALQQWEQLSHTMDELVVDGKFARPSDMLFSVLEGVYDEYLQGSFDNYEHRRADIEQLMSYGEGFDDVLDFLAQLSLMSAVDGDPSGSRAEPDTEQVVLSSVHQAKGLEWKVVFIIWLTDGMFPNGRVLEADDEDMLEEERRLFYVAITRAMNELYMVYPQINPKSYTGDVIQRPSRFLDDCPGELIEEWHVGGGW
ncbi:MAG: ATP-dependent helicase [Akkermansiaceae bacterium]|nr:ATP-dependent helicase [Akkermansiaceae bacterium]